MLVSEDARVGRESGTGGPTGTLVVGLIGEIGAGKSTVARCFAQRGARVIDGDRIGHRVLEEAQTVRQLVDRFGAEILDPQGRIDRRALAHLVFSDSEQRRRLEAVVHPRIRESMAQEIEAARFDPAVPLVVLDAAVLYEAGWQDLCDRVVYVEAPRPCRLARVREARGWSEAELAQRESAQLGPDVKRERVDRVLANDGPLSVCQERVDRLFREWSGEDRPAADDSGSPSRPSAARAGAAAHPSSKSKRRQPNSKESHHGGHE